VKAWSVVANSSNAQKRERASLNNSNTMKADHAALAMSPTGMVAKRLDGLDFARAREGLRPWVLPVT
jgi:hypothetical protein